MDCIDFLLHLGESSCTCFWGVAVKARIRRCISCTRGNGKLLLRLLSHHIHTQSVRRASPATDADTKVYITKPSDYPHSPSKLLLFLSSGTGIHSTNNQLQADQFASEGFLVVMPDQSVY